MLLSCASAINYRNMFIDGKYGDTSVKVFGTPIKMSGTPLKPSQRAPEIGENNAEIYEEFLGYDEKKLEELHQRGVL